MLLVKQIFGSYKVKAMGTYKNVSNWICLVIICKYCCTVWALAPTLAASTNCSSVFYLLESYGLNKAEIPKSVLGGRNLRYCDAVSSSSCCTPTMEMKLISSLRQQFEKTIKDSIGKLSSVLGHRAIKFNEFFEQLLMESKKEFHIMFKKTYGILYEQNSYVFSDFFTELEKYYSRGKVDLAEAIDSFFNTLYQKMFTVLNAQYSFNDKYLGCVSEHMKELKPFGDVPDKLSVQIKRSFVATRTYAQALMTASEVAKRVMNARPTENCTVALMKMQYCGVCKGYSEKPCANYCEKVIKGCLQYYSELDVEWDNFVSSMERVSERLLGPFNIVVVVEPINIKISEAIMNFQETGQDISNQVFQGCGRPVLGRRRRSIQLLNESKRYNERKSTFLRSASNEIIKMNTTFSSRRVTRSVEESKELRFVEVPSSDQIAQQNVKSKKKNKKKSSLKKEFEDDEFSREPVLNKLVKDIKQKVKDSKKFWYNLPYQICNNEDLATLPETGKRCWNGNSVDRQTYFLEEQVDSFEYLAAPKNSRQSSLVSNQLYYLKTAVNRLRNAYNGLDVEWSDQDEPYYGSGSGSGDGINEEDGSGLSSFDEQDPHLPEHVETPVVRVNNVEGTISPDVTGGRYIPSTEKGKSSSKVNGASKMSLRQALITFLFPIYMAWFGGILSDLL